MCCCQFHKVACLFSLLAKAETYASYQCVKGILLHLHASALAPGVQVITVCTVILAVDASQGKLYARIKVETAFIFETLAIFCTDAGTPGLVIAAQLMTIHISNIIVIFQTGIFGNQVYILTIITLPGTIQTYACILQISFATAIIGITIVIGYCQTN